MTVQRCTRLKYEYIFIKFKLKSLAKCYRIVSKFWYPIAYVQKNILRWHEASKSLCNGKAYFHIVRNWKTYPHLGKCRHLPSLFLSQQLETSLSWSVVDFAVQLVSLAVDVGLLAISKYLWNFLVMFGVQWVSSVLAAPLMAYLHRQLQFQNKMCRFYYHLLIS